MTILATIPTARRMAVTLICGAAAALAVCGHAAAAGPNLIPGGDMAAGAGGFTAYAGRGAPAQLDWGAAGHLSPGSLSVTYADGSAGGPAWYSPEVPVAESGSYVVSVSSRGIDSELLVRFAIADGSYRWRTLARVPRSAAWIRTKARMRVPADAISASVYQEITSPGTLETDDYSLVLESQPDLGSGIPNGDLEQADEIDSSRPLGWSGHPMSAASYSTIAGRGGGRAVRVSLSGYRPGQAQAYWETDPVPVSPGETYQFSNWYRSTVESRVYVEIQRADGSWREIALKTVGPSPSRFTRYQTRFVAPSWARSVTLIHVPLAKGWLATDDYSLARVGAGSFDRATVSLTFDDGFASDASAAAPALSAARMQASFYPVTGLIGEPGYMTRDQLRSLALQGHEISSHTASHPDLTTISAGRRAIELLGSRLELNGLLGPGTATGVASPYGSYDSTVLSAIGLAGYRYHRTLDEGFNEPNDWDPMRIRSYLVMSSTTPEELQAMLSRAAADRTWLVLVYHAVTEGGDVFSVTPAQLASQLAQIGASGARVLPVSRAMTVLSPQVPQTRAAVAKRKKARGKARSRRHATPLHRAAR